MSTSPSKYVVLEIVVYYSGARLSDAYTSEAVWSTGTFVDFLDAQCVELESSYRAQYNLDPDVEVVTKIHSYQVFDNELPSAQMYEQPPTPPLPQNEIAFLNSQALALQNAMRYMTPDRAAPFARTVRAMQARAEELSSGSSSDMR